MCSVSVPSSSRSPAATAETATSGAGAAGTTTSPSAVRLVLPASLAEAVDGRRVLQVVPEAPTIDGLLAALRTQYSRIFTRICDAAGAVRRYVNIYVDEEDIRDIASRGGSIVGGTEVLVLQSVAGG